MKARAGVPVFRELLAHPAGGHAIDGVVESGQCDLRREIHQQVDVVVLAAELDEFAFRSPRIRRA